MRINKSIFYATIYSIITFFISLYISPFYTEGDQSYYREFYNQCLYEGYNLEQQIFCYKNSLGASEPVYFFISKFAHSLYLDKDLYIAIANAILTFFFVNIIFKYYKVIWHRQIFISLVLTNYYLIVMFFSAERLKFGFIFLALALLLASKKRMVLFAVSLLSHIQMAIMIAPYFISKVFSKDSSKLVKILTVLSASILFIGIFYYMQGHIETKFNAYSNSDEGNIGIVGALKTSIFIILATISTRKVLAIISGIPLIALAYFLGSDRIGMLAFIMYVGFVLYYKRKMDVLLFITMLYCSYKSVNFVSNIIQHGSGYAS